MVDNIRLPKKIPAGVLKELVRERGQIFQSTSALERAGVEGATKRDVAAINKLIAEIIFFWLLKKTSLHIISLLAAIREKSRKPPALYLIILYFFCFSKSVAVFTRL